MRFSVIIPLYNGAKFIERTLDSVVSQTFRDFEVVLVNDGSPDNAGVVVKEYVKKHPEVKFVYIEQKNKGLGGARNTAIRNSTGQMIAMIDQDDLWYPEKLETVDRAFSENPSADIVSHDINISTKNGKKIFRTGPASKDMFRALLFKGNLLRTPSVSFRKSALERAGYFSEDRKVSHLVEDYDLWLRMALTGLIFCFIRDVLAEYLVHEENFSSKSGKALINMSTGEINTIRTYFKLLRRRRPLDWYNINRRIAKILYSTSRKLAFEYGDFVPAAGYLCAAVLRYPFYPLEYAGKLIGLRGENR